MSVMHERNAGAPPYGEYSRLEHENEQNVRSTAKTLAGAFSLEAIVSAVGLAAAICALVGGPQYMLPAAIITIGAALFIKGTGVVSQFGRLIRQTGAGRFGLELGSGSAAELLAGLAGISLGVMVLIDILPTTLAAVAVIVFGGALLFGGGETHRLSQLRRMLPRTSNAEFAAHVSQETAAGVESLGGVACIVLGILALTGVAPASVMIAVGLITAAGVELLSGGATGVHAMTLTRKQ